MVFVRPDVIAIEEADIDVLMKTPYRGKSYWTTLSDALCIDFVVDVENTFLKYSANKQWCLLSVFMWRAQTIPFDVLITKTTTVRPSAFHLQSVFDISLINITMLHL